MFATPSIEYVSARELTEDTEDPLLDIDALLIDENWHILAREKNRSIYRKKHTDYDIIDIQHTIEPNGGHSFHATFPLTTSRYAFATNVRGAVNMFNFTADFIEHYATKHISCIQHT